MLHTILVEGRKEGGKEGRKEGRMYVCMDGWMDGGESWAWTIVEKGRE